ncbi:MobF family relaxase [Streptomyces sp. B6B3]|uniref:MobF family relaxase n=1 Tax=Streptomyces sp. B6B3 TaxID=3153570 RepID=UPI00325F68B2
MMTIHKLSAGDGYLYYTREIATGDELLSGHRELSGFYSSDGTPPGVWVGSGCVELGVEGDVTEAQIRALYGEGLHPDADRIIEQATAGGASATEAVRRARLGRRYYRYEQTEGPLTARVQDSIQRHEVRKGRAATATERERLRNAIGAVAFREDFGRAPGDGEELRRYVRARTVCRRQAVAGYDLVFRNKHASVLWALTDEETGLQVQAAHEQAIAETLEWIEENALATRTGRDGIAQEDVRGGLVAAQYRHYDSRRGDPLLHDHVVVANKVCGLDGRWRSIDGKLLYAMGVAASELYNQRVVEELCRRLGVRAEERVVTPGRRPVMAVSGLDDDLIDAFSKRAHDIRTDLPRLLEEYRHRYGKEPEVGARMALIEQAAQRSRPRKKKARALQDLRAEWRAEAVARFGKTRIDGLLERARRAAAAVPEPRSAVAVDVEEAAGEVLRVVSAERSVWARRHVIAEARRQVVRLTNGRGATKGLAERVIQHVVERLCLDLTPPDPHPPFAPLLRADGTSVHRRRDSQLYTSNEVLAAEARLVNAARALVVPALSTTHFAALPERYEGPALSAGELRLAEEFVCSERLLSVGVVPVGSGKTTVLRLIRNAVATGGGRLVPLAASSRAAEVLEGELNVPAHPIRSWLAERDRIAESHRVKEESRLQPGDVIVVDEAGMAGTLRLARVVAEAEAAGALVRLIGAPAQLGTVASGRALRLVAHEVGAVELESPHHFRTSGEAGATLTLRDGDPDDAWRWYLDQGRVVSGGSEETLDSLFASWQADTEAGRLSVMMADDTEHARSLNARAQTFQLVSGRLGPPRSAALHDAQRATVGDLVITRKTERRLPVNAGRDFVKNGDQWHVEHLDPDGNATVRHTAHGGRVVLSAAYLRRHGQLGYATTVHHAQGLAADTSHGLITARTSRASAYAMATRGSHSNHLHIAVDEGQSALDVLDAVTRNTRATAPGIGSPPDRPTDIRARSALQQRITDLGRRARTSSTTHASPDGPAADMSTAARTANAISTGALNTLVLNASDREVITAVAQVFADVALRDALRREQSSVEWLRQIPTPDPEDTEQQDHWRQLVAALTTWRMLCSDPTNAPLNEGQTQFHAALDLLQRARIRERLAQIRTLNDVGTMQDAPTPPRKPPPRTPETADEAQRQQRPKTPGDRRGPRR